MRRLSALVLSGALLAAAADTLGFQLEPFQPALQRYYKAIEDICRTGVTPDLVRLYDDARQAVEAAGYGGGRDNNFWGVKPPDRAYNECFQSPSFL